MLGSRRLIYPLQPGVTGGTKIEDADYLGDERDRTDEFIEMLHSFAQVQAGTLLMSLNGRKCALDDDI